MEEARKLEVIKLEVINLERAQPHCEIGPFLFLVCLNGVGLESPLSLELSFVSFLISLLYKLKPLIDFFGKVTAASNPTGNTPNITHRYGIRSKANQK